MPDTLKTVRHWLAVGWFWPVVLLVLPNCSFTPGSSTTTTTPPGSNVNRGDSPLSSAVFCDIEPMTAPPAIRHCASADEITNGIRLADGAIALNNGSSGQIVIDDSPQALTACGGTPQAVSFFGAFPEGFLTCVNANDVGPSGAYPTTDALCAAQCEDFFGTTDANGNFVPTNPPDPGTVTWCTAVAHAHASTNFPETPLSSSLSFANACTDAGMLSPSFVDPRRAPEPVAWENLSGASASGSTLTKTKTTNAFDSGGVSTQTIDSNDGFVDFTTTDNTTAKVIGLTTGPPAGDTDPRDTTLNFGVGLSNAGQIFVYENGNQSPALGMYGSGDRFRVRVHDRFDGTATVTYSTVSGTCNPGSACNEQVFYTSTRTGAYPFHVDTSLYDPNATLTNVQLVRIHQ